MFDTSVIKKYFPEISVRQERQFDKLGPLYSDWNSKINVISRKDIHQLYTRHVLHSLGIAKVVTFREGAEILDVGTGGGFPGVPLAILFPNAHFHLIDSIGKKITVVKQVARELGLQNLKASKVRAEEVNGHYDYVVSRAVTRIGPFYKWVQDKFKKESQYDLKNGVLYLKGGDVEEELKESRLRYKIHSMQHFFDEEFFKTKKVLYVPDQ